jgi:hypothetical protein
MISSELIRQLHPLLIREHWTNKIIVVTRTYLVNNYISDCIVS